MADLSNATSSSAPAREPRRVLVIDDDPHVAGVLNDLLKIDGCDVRTARDGLEALEIIQAGPLPDVIFLDMHMAGLDGWGFRARLQELGLAIPTVVVTGDSRPALCAEEIGAVAYVMKPFDLSSLDAVLDEMIVTRTQGTGSGH
jgi:CheY-like chemotaxis protein